MLARSPALIIGAAMLLLWIMASLLAPWIAPASPVDSDFLAMSAGPSPAHWFGTDQLGRDVASRVLYGGRSVLLVAPAATALGVSIGTAIGLLAGYWGGVFDEAIMRTLDAVMALPIVVLATLALAFLGASTLNVIVVIGAIYAPFVARSVRAAVLAERGRDYVAAAVLRGESLTWILFREILPNVRGPLIAEATTRLGYAVFTSATLGFLGFGVPPPNPDWGRMVSENQSILTTAPWATLFPAGAIAFVVVAFGLLVEGLTEE